MLALQDAAHKRSCGLISADVEFHNGNGFNPKLIA